MSITCNQLFMICLFEQRKPFWFKYSTIHFYKKIVFNFYLKQFFHPLETLKWSRYNL